jgi:hypothetical protein
MVPNEFSSSANNDHKPPLFNRVTTVTMAAGVSAIRQSKALEVFG